MRYDGNNDNNNQLQRLEKHESRPPAACGSQALPRVVEALKEWSVEIRFSLTNVGPENSNFNDVQESWNDG